MTKEDAGAKANRKAKEAAVQSRARREGVARRAFENQADLNAGGKSLLRRLLGG